MENKNEDIRISFNYKGTEILVVKNDITNEEVDCIVNAANESLDHGGGVAGAISFRGGPEVQMESDEYVRKNGIVNTGKVGITGPGRLPCKKIIHAVGPVFRNGRDGEDEELESAIIESFRLANNLNYKSISIPAISSGIFGYPKPRCAAVMIKTVKKFINEVQGSNFSLKKIRLTNFDEETTELLEKEAEKFKENPENEIVLPVLAEKKYYSGWIWNDFSQDEASIKEEIKIDEINSSAPGQSDDVVLSQENSITVEEKDDKTQEIVEEEGRETGKKANEVGV